MRKIQNGEPMWMMKGDDATPGEERIRNLDPAMLSKRDSPVPVSDEVHRARATERLDSITEMEYKHKENRVRAMALKADAKGGWTKPELLKFSEKENLVTWEYRVILERLGLPPVPWKSTKNKIAEPSPDEPKFALQPEVYTKHMEKAYGSETEAPKIFAEPKEPTFSYKEAMSEQGGGANHEMAASNATHQPGKPIGDGAVPRLPDGANRYYLSPKRRAILKISDNEEVIWPLDTLNERYAHLHQPGFGSAAILDEYDGAKIVVDQRTGKPVREGENVCMTIPKDHPYLQARKREEQERVAEYERQVNSTNFEGLPESMPRSLSGEQAQAIANRTHANMMEMGLGQLGNSPTAGMSLSDAYERRRMQDPNGVEKDRMMAFANGRTSMTMTVNEYQEAVKEAREIASGRKVFSVNWENPDKKK